MIRKIVLGIFIFSILSIGIAELVLRYKYGFCSAPLYVADTDYEYIYAPNQHVVRFGNLIETNSLSMRSKEVNSSDTTVILLIGDSVVLGGSLTDQNDLASTLLENQLSIDLKTKVRVLNISAGSWGPDNGAAYLKKHGLFNAKLICLVASSHDAHDNMTHSNTVGIDYNLPDKQYPFALKELWDRYIYPRYISDYSGNSIYFAPKIDTLATHAIHKNGPTFNSGFDELNRIAKENKIPFFILLHPETSEVASGNYNYEGQAIINFAKKDSVRLVKELDKGVSLDFYRENDVVHYNSKGQYFLYQNLRPLLLEYFKPTK